MCLFQVNSKQFKQDGVSSELGIATVCILSNYGATVFTSSSTLPDQVQNSVTGYTAALFHQAPRVQLWPISWQFLYSTGKPERLKESPKSKSHN